VRCIAPCAVPALRQGHDGACRIPPGHLPVIGAFAHEKTPLTVEGAPVPFARLLPHHRHLAVRVPAQEPTAGEIDKGHRALGMPERPFRHPHEAKR